MSTTYAPKQVPAQKKDANSAASVVDDSSQGEALQRKADMANCAAQRVVQRDTGVVQRAGAYSHKFKYVDYNDMGGISNSSGKIHFSEYQNRETKSGDFSGCLMMAFRFIESYDDLKRKKVFEDETGIDEQIISKQLIAHVFCDSDLSKDTKSAILDAEDEGLIAIDVLFKPKTPGDCEKTLKNQAEGCSQDFFMGGLTFTQGSSPQNGSWNATVYAQNQNVYDKIKGDYSQSEDVEKKLKFFDNEALIVQTNATRAFVYASLGKYDNMVSILNQYEADENFFNLFLELCSLEVLRNMKDNQIFEGEKELKVQEKIDSLEIQEDVRNFFIKAAFKEYDEMSSIMASHQNDDGFIEFFLVAYSNSTLQNIKIAFKDGEKNKQKYENVRKKIDRLRDPNPSCCNIM